MTTRRRREPVWLTRPVVDAIQLDQLREHGGLQGVRDEVALESALLRRRNKWHYHRDADVPSLAAAYAFGLVRNHPYHDGNKRVGFLAAVVFLELNGFVFEAADADVVVEVFSLAAGRRTESEFADWVRLRSRRAK